MYTDHLNAPRLVTKIDNPQNPKALTDTSNDLPQVSYGEPEGISPLAIPVWQWSYSPFGADLANGYEARPTTIANNFKPDLWAWVGLPETGGADPNQVAQETWRIQANLVVPPVLNLRYPGQYYDFETGLVQNWWRTYEPRIGRYVSADPIGLNGGGTASLMQMVMESMDLILMDLEELRMAITRRLGQDLEFRAQDCREHLLSMKAMQRLLQNFLMMRVEIIAFVGIALRVKIAAQRRTSNHLQISYPLPAILLIHQKDVFVTVHDGAII